MSTSIRVQRPTRLGAKPRKSQKVEMEEWESERTDLQFFRAQTMGIVQHFFEIASQIGRLPSILGREFFRAKISHHAIPSFEEQAVFVCDVARALEKLNETDGEVVALVGLFHFSLDDVAAMLGRSRTGVYTRYSDSIDQLSEIFLETGLLRENRPDRRVRRFPQTPARKRVCGLPPKKPASSVTAEMYHTVGVGSGGGLSFVIRAREAS